jgi:hypothetical protein
MMNPTLTLLLRAPLAAQHAADAGGPERSFDPELWVSRDGRLFCFWAERENGRRDAALGAWCIETSEPDAAQPQACWFTRSSLVRSLFRASPFFSGVAIRRRYMPSLPAQLWRVSEIDAPEPGNTLTPVNENQDPVVVLRAEAGSTCLWGAGRNRRRSKAGRVLRRPAFSALRDVSICGTPMTPAGAEGV